MQKGVLEKQANPDLVVYAVWFAVMPSDRRETWPEGLFTDHRVVELWDEPAVLARWLAAQPALQDKGLVSGGVMWDTFLLFGRGSRWETVPTDLLSSGHTIIHARKRLEADLPSALPSDDKTPR